MIGARAADRGADKYFKALALLAGAVRYGRFGNSLT